MPIEGRQANLIVPFRHNKKPDIHTGFNNFLYLHTYLFHEPIEKL
jgi:hypothetical protein